MFDPINIEAAKALSVASPGQGRRHSHVRRAQRAANAAEIANASVRKCIYPKESPSASIQFARGTERSSIVLGRSQQLLSGLCPLVSSPGVMELCISM